ncbi:MAG TPA: proteasome accessory factor PafA2 family protein [Propioniciclava tarda]|nr:proteasome accessory factor PafA2 family protein [Propioniciclava tarda]HQD59642.1 proteasome accessory factor PafA2 family protein [Propioniciclava tarda]
MGRRVYGLETEYGLSARTRPPGASDWKRLTSDEAARALFAPMVNACATTGAFLSNGGRLYLDVGNHPEYATPECTSIDDLVVAERAGDELMVALAAQATDLEAQAGRDTEFRLFKNNVDSYGNTYGSHENYLVDRATDPDALTAWLVPFLVSRQAIAGAGRWHRGRFTVSQRCDALADVVSNQTTRSRPLINTRDEPHADPSRYRRLHVISGDSNLDESSAWLKYASTELVLRLAESGRPAPVSIDDPVAALRRWGRDPREASEIQARYAELSGEVAEGLEDASAAWRDASVVPEWAHKRRLIEAHRERHSLSDADPRLDALDLRWHALGTDPQGRPLGLARLLEARGELARLTDPVAVAAAREVAPGPGRARLRGCLIAAAKQHGRENTVDWASFVVHDLPASLRLDDPFVESDAEVDALVERMRAEPRRRTVGGFRPPQ